VTPRPLAAAALALTAALALSACSSSSTSGGSTSPSASSTAYVTGTAGVTVTGDLASKPTVTLGADTKGTSQLTVSDLVVGTGAEVKSGDSVTAQYVGIGASTGKEFDSSWSRGQATEFSLGQVIQGWQTGIPGMKVGGRRLLVIPGAQAYGANPPSGSGIEKDETLVFVVDIVPTVEATVGPRVTGTAGVTVTGDAGKEPAVTVTKETAAATAVTISDITVGDGAEAKASSSVSITYVGVGANSGKVFDSSWTNGAPVQLTLSKVIPGFKDGVAGMKVGGRRLIVIPAAQAYGDTPPDGSGIAKGENLVFVVDLVSVP
jgi:peptidylprolyl isomerase